MFEKRWYLVTYRGEIIPLKREDEYGSVFWVDARSENDPNWMDLAIDDIDGSPILTTGYYWAFLKEGETKAYEFSEGCKFALNNVKNFIG